jgi:hypothetical protein
MNRAPCAAPIWRMQKSRRRVPFTHRSGHGPTTSEADGICSRDDAVSLAFAGSAHGRSARCRSAVGVVVPTGASARRRPRDDRAPRPRGFRADRWSSPAVTGVVDAMLQHRRPSSDGRRRQLGILSVRHVGRLGAPSGMPPRRQKAADQSRRHHRPRIGQGVCLPNQRSGRPMSLLRCQPRRTTVSRARRNEFRARAANPVRDWSSTSDAPLLTE